MAQREQLTNEQKRLLRITARMPLASVANLASVTGMTEDRVRRMLGALRGEGWIESVVRGMTERRQHRWFLTRRAVDELYVTDHQHPSPREEARAAGLAEFHPEGELPADFTERFALDHDHPAHLENQDSSPFAAAGPIEGDTDGDGPDHEHAPWTATSRGIETSLRRLAMLEPVYALAPDLLRSGRVTRPPNDAAASREARMTDFRLLRHGGFYHAVARYGNDIWTTFTYAGLHATERVLRRKEQHRFWGVDCYSREEDRYLRIGNRLFYENPDQEVEPSAQIVVAADAWARELARQTLSGNHPHPVLHPRWPVHPGGGAASLQGPGGRPRRPSHRRKARGRQICGSGTTPTWRPSTAGPPTGCSWPSASSPPCGPPGCGRWSGVRPAR